MQGQTFSLEIIYSDLHLMQFEAFFCTNSWSAKTRVYSTFDALSEFTDELTQFAAKLEGVASFDAGTDDGLGYLAMRFYLTNRVKHLFCYVRMSADVPSPQRLESVAKIAIELSTELWALDEFVTDLRQLIKRRNGRAFLPLL